MNKTQPSFRANIRLKDIIGQGLINNSNIALIELIKNSRDAKSKNVRIEFLDANIVSKESQIIVQDFGLGMDLDDIVNKWLNIAYSEKRDQGGFAGDKGIGRFSCDRLGRILDLYTKKSNGDLIHLNVNWSAFEVDDRDKEISSVKFNPKVISAKDFESKTGISSFENGTCLIIRDLREVWSKLDLDRLKKELERFIIDPKRTFDVFLKSNDFLNKDGSLVFNEKIENKLLLRLDEKTISIHSAIVDKGKSIVTEIHHYGDVICSFREDNPYTDLEDIRAQIHYLSQGSKVSFKSITGYSSADYASIMFFYNGFRVMPYGEPKDDWLQLNQRKAQGTMRFLGTRELFGIVEAYDTKRLLAPVSSREGMENNNAFKQLTSPEQSDVGTSYLSTVLGILEKYVVQGIDWDRVKPKGGEFSLEEIEKAIKSVLESHKKNKNLNKVEIDYEKIREIAEEKVSEYQYFVEDLMERVANKPVYELTATEKQDVKKYVIRQSAALEAKEETNKEYLKTIEVEKKRRLFAESHLTSDTQRVRNLQHLIGNLNGELCDELEDVLRAESKGKPLSYQETLKVIRSVFFKANKIRTLSQIIIKANFDMMSETINYNIFSYIEQYITDMRRNGAAWGIAINFENEDNVDLQLNFSPLEVGMLVDNVLSNASKANAKNISIRASDKGREFIVEFIDDGDGLSDRYTSEDYFKEGISTTRRGAGIGLSQIRQIVEDRQGQVEIFSNDGAGATLKIWWDK